jgi:hypothetical protein
MRKLLVVALVGLGFGLTACETMPVGPPPPPPPPPQAAPSPYIFRSGDFAWSAIPGGGRIEGHVTFRQGPTLFSCSNVALIPETPYSARRMMTLYGSTNFAYAPVAEVQSRTPPAPTGFNTFVKLASCDAQNRFVFTGLADGAWFVITSVKPTTGSGPSMALMRRVVTRAGRPLAVEL